MADTVSKEKRSEIMASVGNKDTQPELIIRKGIHGRGYRYSLNDNSLPGRPDIKMPKYNAIIFIHGCFWHGHEKCGSQIPKSNKKFWRNKIERNKERDRKNTEKLLELGWRVLTIWECAIEGKNSLSKDKLLKNVTSWIESESQRAIISS